MPVLGVRQQHAGQKRAKRRRQAGHLHQQRNAHHHQQRSGGKHLHRISLRHETEHWPQQVATADYHRHDHPDRAQHAEQVDMLRRGGGHQRHHGDQRNRRQILEQQDREHLTPIGRPDFLAFGQDLQAEGGRGQRQAAADNRRRLAGEPEQEVGRRADHQQRGQYLQQPGAEHRAPHDPQPLGRQLQSDNEQHQYHAEFGDRPHALGIADQAQQLWPDQHPGQQIAQYRAKPESLGQRHHDHGGQ